MAEFKEVMKHNGWNMEHYEEIMKWASEHPVKSNEDKFKEEICEWKMPNNNADEWTTDCEKNSVFNVFGVGWFKYCPYCGKKIKIVE